MTTAEAWGALATLVVIAGYWPYIISFAKGGAKPHVFSWLLWGATSFVIFIGQVEGHAGPGAWMMLANGVMAVFIGLCALRWGERHIEKNDWIAALTGATGLAAWLVTDHIIAALLVMALVDLMAFAPTMRKSWHKPEEENLPFYVINTVAVAISLLAVEEVNFLSSFNLAFFLAIQSAFIGMAFWRRCVLARLHGQFCYIPQPSI